MQTNVMHENNAAVQPLQLKHLVSTEKNKHAVWETFISLISPFWLVASKLYSPN
jgi:hypothetical protein